MKMESDVTKMVEEIAMQAKENQEEFIFETIRPYCENILQIKINKEELKQILLNGMRKQQPCKDAISREELRNLICQHNDKYGYSDRFHEFTERCSQLPSVKPQQKTGHWISHRDHCENLGAVPSGLGAYEWCSNCDCGIDVKEFHRNYYNFCPNCGAKMTESEE